MSNTPNYLFIIIEYNFREITISRSSPSTVDTLIRRNEVPSLGAVEENAVVKTEQ